MPCTKSPCVLGTASGHAVVASGTHATKACSSTPSVNVIVACSMWATVPGAISQPCDTLSYAMTTGGDDGGSEGGGGEDGGGGDGSAGGGEDGGADGGGKCRHSHA